MTMPARPSSAAWRASSARWTPLRRMGSFVMERSQARSGQERDGSMKVDIARAAPWLRSMELAVVLVLLVLLLSLLPLRGEDGVAFCDESSGSCRPLLLHAAGGAGILESHVALASAELWCVYSHEEALASALLGVLDDASGDFAVLVDVELQPLHLSLPVSVPVPVPVRAAVDINIDNSRRVNNLIKPTRRQGRNHLRHAEPSRCPSQYHFALRVS